MPPRRTVPRARRPAMNSKPPARSRRVRNMQVKQSRRLFGIKQGVGRVTRVPFGPRRNPIRRMLAVNPRLALNANHPSHLALPRAVGPYSVTRVTQSFDLARAVTLLGPMMAYATNKPDDGRWSALVGACSHQASSAINAINNTHFLNALSLGNYSSQDSVAVSAFSVQVMNANALQTTSGMLYIGRLHTAGSYGGSAQTWEEAVEEFISFNAPRLCSAGKLALRGVTLDAVPYNMSELSNFTDILSAQNTNPTIQDTWSDLVATGTRPSTARFAGFAPIVIYNPTLVPLTVLVTVELRTRFAATNPAQASHTHHPIASDATWDAAIRSMVREGHGTKDIAEVVANRG